MTLLYVLLAFFAGFIIARRTAKPITLPCLCSDASISFHPRHSDEDAAGRVH